MSEHSELIERLKAATEGSRELDREMMLLAGDAREVDHCTFYGPDERVWYFGEYEHETDLPPLPYLTSSLDAIVGLIERKFSPGLGWSLVLDTSDSTAILSGPDGEYFEGGKVGASIHCAACIALLSALQQGGAEQ